MLDAKSSSTGKSGDGVVLISRVAIPNDFSEADAVKSVHNKGVNGLIINYLTLAFV